MKINLFAQKERRGIMPLKIVLVAILLPALYFFYGKKEKSVWKNPKERVIVRALQQVDVSPKEKLEKPKPPVLVKAVANYVENKEESDVVVEEKKESKIVAEKRPLKQVKSSKFNAANMQSNLSKAKETPLLVAEEMPRFPGCELENMGKNEKQKCAEWKLLKYLQHNIEYPEMALAKGTEGVVYLQFVVEKTGEISHVKIQKDIGGNCGAEAKRVVENMPNWSPGKQGGMATSVQFNLPVKFSMN